MKNLTERDMNRLSTCHVDLQSIVIKAAALTPLMVIWGFRNEEQQNDEKKNGYSPLAWPDSKHNHMEDGLPQSLAVDLAPLPLEWKNLQHFRVLASYMWQVSVQSKINLKWLGHIGDYGHFELIA